MLLLLLVLVLAIAGGFLGELLEFAAWLVVVLTVIGAALGFLVYRFVRGLKDRWT